MATYNFPAEDEYGNRKTVWVSANGRKHAKAKAIIAAGRQSLKITDNIFAKYGKNKNGRKTRASGQPY